MISSDEEDWRDEVEYVEKEVRVGLHTLRILEMEELSISASLNMLAEMKHKDTEISGMHMWTGSRLLALYLQEHPKFVNERSVLELGAGTGICSIVASKLGAKRVHATDGDAEVVSMMRKNIQLNPCSSEFVMGSVLHWGSVREIAELVENNGGSHFDTIIAGDVLYKGSLLPLLFQTVHWVFEQNEAASFLLCHIPRADVTHQRVLDEAIAMGFKYEVLKSHELLASPLINALDNCPKEDIEKARIYRFSQ